MPRYTGSVTLRPELGQVAYDFMQDQQDYIGLKAMPLFDVVEKSASFPILKLESMLKVQETKRAPRSAYNRGDWEIDGGVYNCTEDGWEEPLDDTEAAMYRRFFDAEMVCVQRAATILAMNMEKVIANLVMNTANAGGNAAATAAWDVAANAKPLLDVTNAKDAMLNASGLRPNTLVMSEYTCDRALLSDEVKNALRYTDPVEFMPKEQKRRMLAMYFNVDQVLVGQAIVDGAPKGKSRSLTRLWNDDYVALLKVHDGMDLRTPAFGRTFFWAEDSASNPAAGLSMSVEQYRDEAVRSNIYRARHHTDPKAIFTGANYIITGAKS